MQIKYNIQLYLLIYNKIKVDDVAGIILFHNLN